jgi:hypothetical protein
LYLVVNLCETENRQNVRASIKDSKTGSLVEVKVPVALTEKSNSIFIQTEEDEISYQGKMYDVVSSNRSADGFVHYYCVNDQVEEGYRAIQDQLTQESSSVAGNKQISCSSHKHKLKTFVTEYLPLRKGILSASCPIYIDFNSDFLILSKSCFSKVPSPPPQFG